MMIQVEDDNFEWDAQKDQSNLNKHGISFQQARLAFLDETRVIAEDLEHSSQESRYYCFGKVDSLIMTVRFTLRNHKIRIIGAGYWRKGKHIYEQAQKERLH